MGQNVSSTVEIRESTPEAVVDSIEDSLFSERIYYDIRYDLKEKYINENKTISLKTIWFYSWTVLEASRQYDHKFMSQLMKNGAIAAYVPGLEDGYELLDHIAKYFENSFKRFFGYFCSTLKDTM